MAIALIFVLALSMLSSGIKVALMEDRQIATDMDGTILEKSGTKERQFAKT